MFRKLKCVCSSFFLLILCSVPLFVDHASASHPAGETGFSAEIETGIGYDSNAHRTPEDPYIDYSQIGNPLVTPDIKSGIFIPLDIKASYRSSMSGSNYGIVAYKFSGDFYTSSDTDTASDYKHKLSGGLEMVFSEQGKKRDSLYFGPYIVNSRDLYIDRDSGDEQLSTGGTDLSERYVYTGYGAEIEYDSRTGYLQYGIEGKYEIRDYKDVVAISQLDHSYYDAGIYLQIPIGDPAKLKLSYDYAVRDYDERASRASDGSAAITNPARNYTYNTYRASLHSDVAKGLDLYIDYSLKTRTDAFEGYDDYIRNKYGARVIYKEKGLRLRGQISFWTRDYDNAFAFDNPTQEAKKYDGMETELSGEYKLRDKWSVWSEVDYDTVNSTDKRYEYGRYQVIAGIKWEY